MGQVFSVTEFCKRWGISRALFYKLRRDGIGPKVMKVGNRTMISEEASEDWRRRLEAREA